VNADPAGVQVRADSPYKNVQGRLAAIKANPGKFKASGTGQGGIWHLALIAGCWRDLKIDPASVPWVPSQRRRARPAGPGAGGIEFVPCSLPEARSLIDAGKVRSLAVMADKPAALYPNVPTLKAATGSRLGHWRLARHRGAQGLPAGHPQQAGGRVKQGGDSKEYNDFMASAASA
jgi:tripartite-type tricarboxylate transporter receptor subunit TctC